MAADEHDNVAAADPVAVRKRRFGKVPVRYLLPNMITLLALCSGITAIRLGVEGRYELAVAAVMVAVVLDAIDGRLARFLKGTSRFGAELELARRLREFRSDASDPHLPVVAELAAHRRLDHSADPGNLLRVAAGPVQRGAG